MQQIRGLAPQKTQDAPAVPTRPAKGSCPRPAHCTRSVPGGEGRLTRRPVSNGTENEGTVPFQMLRVVGLASLGEVRVSGGCPHARVKQEAPPSSVRSAQEGARDSITAQRPASRHTHVSSATILVGQRRQ